MKKQSIILKTAEALQRTAIVLAAALMLASCRGIIYDYEGDCSVRYNLSFEYTRNLKWADAFANEVRSVHVFAYNSDGVLEREFIQNNPETLQKKGYSMNLDLPAGDYHLVAWCGTENPQAQKQFILPETQTRVSELSELSCLIDRKKNDDYQAYSDQWLEFLFHGAMDVSLPELPDGGDTTFTMQLTKNTNHVRITLQQTSDQQMDTSDFDFRIEDRNGYYHHDNSLLDDELITYLPYDTIPITAGMDEQSRAMIYTSGMIADLSVGRLMADRSNDMYLTITRRSTGQNILRIPLIQYTMMAKKHYEEKYGHKMTPQEFLDREDEFEMVLFLGQDQEWLKTYIYIKEWRIVLHDYEL